MSNTAATTASVDILQAFAFAGLATETSRWGFIQHRTADGRIVRVLEDDATFFLYVMSANEVIESELKIAGRMAGPVALAALIELAVEA